MNTIPPDEHLRQALRHAPDAEVSAPSDVSAQILAAAHRSAAQRAPAPAPVPAPGAGRRWWAALWRRRGATAALASVVTAGFVGLLWRGEVPGPAVDGPAAQVPSRAANPLAREAVGEMTPTGAPVAAPAAEKPKKMLAAAPAPALTEQVAPPKIPAPEQRRRPANAIRGTNTADAMQATEAMQAVEATRRAIGNAAPTPAPVLRTQPAEIAPVQPDPPSAAETIAQTEDRARSPRPSAAPTAAAPAARSTQRSTVADQVSGPPWLAVAASGDRWRWQSEGTLREPDAQWWDALTRATVGHWQIATDGEPVAASVRLDGQRGTQRVGQLWLEPASVLWCGASPPCQRAPLSAQSRRELLNHQAR